MTELGVWEILKSPVVTEKSVLLKEASSEDENVGQILTFRVNTKAGKIAIKKAVEEIFSVKVSKVRTVHYEGKIKKRGRYAGRRASWTQKRFS
jgi:large subunit ribosomal protein L23